MIYNLIIAGSITFCSVFLKGFQHKNVVGNHFKLVFITSYFMAVLDVLAVGMIVKVGWIAIIPCGLGASTGMVLAMYLHNKYVKRGQQI